ncbi:uncharacterized protein LOC131247052 [Magnolia sinica]|uniref:uncharacterized protein LOC131247052 n=1 Tax=Magnolia sinica TaxID=86752 RepID=UPI002657E867|nr:uncharacterized protein LOC131247052 [Magnolia sinica]
MQSQDPQSFSLLPLPSQGIFYFTQHAQGQDPQSSIGGVVEGILLVSACIAHVLFDCSTSHSFVAKEFFRSTSILSEFASEALAVSTPLGKSVVLSRHCSSCPVLVREMILPTDLFVMPMAEFNVILGIDWVVEYHAILDCAARIVTFHIPDLPVFQFVAEPRGEQLSSLLACMVEEFVARCIEQLPIVCEYLDVY